MEKIEFYFRYYEEHALQARRHEEQREKATAIVLTIAGFLIGFVTFAKLSRSALPAAISIILLGIYGYLFAWKHYERSRMHTAVLRRVRTEMEKMIDGRNPNPRTLTQLREEAEDAHNKEFVWTIGGKASKARSWITRTRLHSFWEAIHVGVVILGIGLCFAILTKKPDDNSDPPTKIAIVGWPSAASQPAPKK
jgi:hypothetical protein